jgi:tRNA pseudouridine38-40 synthase
MGAPLRVAALLAYDGSRYHGFQIQPGLETIQGVIETELNKLSGDNIRLFSAGRTDSGVHAHGQVIHFDIESSSIPGKKWSAALNQQLPDDIRILKSGAVQPDFHSRYDANRRRYSYTIGRHSSILDRHRVWDLRAEIDMEIIGDLMQAIRGKHDFSSFCQARTETDNHICVVARASIEMLENQIRFHLEANRFLHHMVRMLVGSMVEAGRGKWTARQFLELLEKPDLKAATYTAPARGLILEEVGYPEKIKLPWR